MAVYKVVVETRGVEVYYVEADSLADAEENWSDGELYSQEVVAVVDWSAEEVTE